MSMRSTFGNMARFLCRLSTAGWKKRFPLSRYAGYKAILKYFYGDESWEVLSIGNSEYLGQVLGFHLITDASLPSSDLLYLGPEVKDWDAIIVDQVLEHVKGNPFQAMAESFRVVKEGGIVLHTSTFYNKKHCAEDFWRFSPEALRMMAEEHGEVIVYGGTGNPIMFFLMNIGLNSELVPESSLHPLNWIARWNDGKRLIFTWVIGRKCENLLKAR